MADEQDKDRNWLKWGMGLGGGVLLVGTGLIFLPSPLDSDDEDEPAASQQQEAAEEDPADQAPDGEDPNQEDEAAAAGECDLPSDDDDFPTEAPDFEWEDHHGAQVPVSDEHGPADQDGEFWQCFSQTPTGATFAAMAFFMDFGTATTDEVAADSPGADAAFEEVQTFTEDVDLIFQGFRVNEASDDHASVTYWVTPETDPGAGDVQMTVELVWDEDADDWRLDLTRGFPEFEPLDDTSGFVQWR